MRTPIILNRRPTVIIPSYLKAALLFDDNLENELDNGIAFSQVTGTSTNATGKINQGLSVSSGSVIRSSSNNFFKFDTTLKNTVLSFSFWYKTDTEMTNTSNTFLSFSSDNHPFVFYFDHNNSNQFRFGGRNSSNNGYITYITQSSNAGTGWHLVSGFLKKTENFYSVKLWWDTSVKIDTVFTPQLLQSTNPYIRLDSDAVAVSYDTLLFWAERELTQANVEDLYQGPSFNWILENLA